MIFPLDLCPQQASNNGHAPTTPCYRRDPRIDSAHSANCTDYDATLYYSRAALYPIAMPTSVLPSIVPQMTVFQKGFHTHCECTHTLCIIYTYLIQLAIIHVSHSRCLELHGVIGTRMGSDIWHDLRNCRLGTGLRQ